MDALCAFSKVSYCFLSFTAAVHVVVKGYTPTVHFIGYASLEPGLDPFYFHSMKAVGNFLLHEPMLVVFKNPV